MRKRERKQKPQAEPDCSSSDSVRKLEPQKGSLERGEITVRKLEPQGEGRSGPRLINPRIKQK